MPSGRSCQRVQKITDWKCLDKFFPVSVRMGYIVEHLDIVALQFTVEGRYPGRAAQKTAVGKLCLRQVFYFLHVGGVGNQPGRVGMEDVQDEQTARNQVTSSGCCESLDWHRFSM